MVRPDDGGNELEIDPQAVTDMQKATNPAVANAQTKINGYIGRLSRYGLDTGQLSKALGDLQWWQDQQASLNYRVELAVAMQRAYPGSGPWVSGGAGSLDFTNAQAAQQAGNDAGGKAQQALLDHSNTDFIADDLAQHADDPEYMAAYFKALGPHGVAQLGLQVNGYKQQGQDDKYQGWSGLVSNGLATASYKMPFSQDWLSQITLPNDYMGGPGPELDLLQPFLEGGGVYSPDWLQPLGKYALYQAYIQGQEPGMMPPPQLDGIWEAIAHNPAYDAKFYMENFQNKDPNEPYPPSISLLMTNPMLTHSVVDGAFADMVRGATLPPQGDPLADPKPYAANAELTVRFFGDNPDARTSGAVRQALGVMAMNYFGDLTATVGSAAPGMGVGKDGKPAPDIPGLGVTASSGEWANFVKEGMRDKTTSAQLLTFYSAWRNQVPDNQGFWNDESFKLMDRFIVHQYQATGQQAGKSNEAIAEIASAAGSAFITSLVFGPEAGVGAALLEGIKDGFKSGVEKEIGQAFPSDELESPESPEAIQSITQANSNWDRIVRNWYNDGGRPAGPGVTYNHLHYDGNPDTYINQFGGPGKANFLDDGKIKELDQMTPDQLAAYDAWLRDPAIADANNDPGGTYKANKDTFKQQTSDF
jgi:hypothetical protein